MPGALGVEGGRLTKRLERLVESLLADGLARRFEMLRDLVCPRPLLGLGLEADRFLRVAAALVVELRETLAERRKDLGWRAQRVRAGERMFRVLELATFEVSGDSFLNRGDAACPSLCGLSLGAQPVPFLE